MVLVDIGREGVQHFVSFYFILIKLGKYPYFHAFSYSFFPSPFISTKKYVSFM